MQVNHLYNLIEYKAEGSGLSLVIECGVSEALTMDTAIIEVYSDEGELLEAFTGYVKRGAAIDLITGYTTLTLYLDTDGTGSAINALGRKVADLGKQNDDTAAVLSALLEGE